MNKFWPFRKLFVIAKSPFIKIAGIIVLVSIAAFSISVEFVLQQYKIK
jgi:hypothetical protein